MLNNCPPECHLRETWKMEMTWSTCQASTGGTNLMHRFDHEHVFHLHLSVSNPPVMGTLTTQPCKQQRLARWYKIGFHCGCAKSRHWRTTDICFCTSTRIESILFVTFDFSMPLSIENENEIEEQTAHAQQLAAYAGAKLTHEQR